MYFFPRLYIIRYIVECFFKNSVINIRFTKLKKEVKITNINNKIVDKVKIFFKFFTNNSINTIEIIISPIAVLPPEI